jgi:hypothetical protein
MSIPITNPYAYYALCGAMGAFGVRDLVRALKASQTNPDTMWRPLLQGLLWLGIGCYFAAQRAGLIHWF